MSTIMGSIVKNSTDINDEVIADKMLAAAEGTASAYLMAAMKSATPELRAVYSANLNQVMGGQAALTELSIKNGWQKPYNSPAHQLSETYIKSRDSID